MKISKKKFVLFFLISAFSFMFITTSLLGSTGVRGFPKYPDSLLGTNSQVEWKNTVSTIILPIKIVLMAPLLPFDNFLQDDPPPPFVAIFFTFYWSLLALVLYYFIGKIKNSPNFR